jgi:ketosteroid isomerase-like protein
VSERLIPLFEAIDAKNVQKFASFLTDDVSFRFGNAPAVVGRTEVAKAVAGFFASIQGLRHRLTEVWREPNTMICEGQVTYTRLDGRVLEVPFLNVLRTRGQLVADYRIYIDVSALYA